MKQVANAVREGHEVAGGTGSLSEAWGDAMAHFEEEGDTVTFNINVARSFRRAMSDAAAGAYRG